MIWQCWTISSLAALGVAFSVAGQNLPAPAQNRSEVPRSLSPQTPSEIMPPISPVTYFRKLLAMTPQERENCLTNRPPQTRERILAKVNEYEKLSPDERELRLRATELRWFLMPLLQINPASREGRLAKVPADLRGIVKARLTEWDILPEPLRAEFLENERAMYYFAGVRPPANSAAEQELQAKRAGISTQFNQFLELTPDEKQDTLSLLSSEERMQMQKTLESFEKLMPAQKNACVRNYAKFAGMSEIERAEFLKNAERWSQMSPTERQTWRDLVANVPDWPPLPASFIYPPGMIPGAAGPAVVISRPSVATN